jgi:REP element-mobilizing transposase RayT
MTRSRREQVCVSSTPYYHCISRCVRRAFLCGADVVTGRSFDHRKQWLVDRMRLLSAVFAVDICAYAVMSNHFHLVLRLAPERAQAWDDDELLDRLEVLFRPMAKAIRELPARARKQALAPWRERLGDLSWFMRCLNEWIARRANQEDGCTGRFWEGRFKSQALLDEGALITCMSYVDLNPVRAGLAKTLEDAEFTSIQTRLFEAAGRVRASKKAASNPKRPTRQRVASLQAPLVPFAPELTAKRSTKSSTTKNPPRALPMTLASYVQLLEQVGTALRADGKPGALSPSATSSLQRLGIAPEHFITTLRGYAKSFFTMVGHVDAIDTERERLGMLKVKGRRAAQRMYAAA